MLSAIRNFFITLISALILLGLVGYLITDFALASLDPERAPSQNPIDTQTQGSTGEPTTDPVGPDHPIIPTKDESFTILLIGHDHQPDVFDDYDRSDETGPTAFPLPNRPISADMLVLMRVDQKTNTVLLCNIPANARISDMGLTKSLGSLYGEYGPAYLTERVVSLAGIPVDYYVSVGIAGLTELIDQIGGITYNVPQDMECYVEEEGYTISLRKGTQRLSGAKVLQLLRYSLYDDDGTTRRNTAVSVLKAVIEKVASDRDYYDNAAKIYNTMSKHVQTNFTQEDMARKLDLMFLYPSMTVNSTQYPGRSVRVETIIYPETEEQTTAPEQPGPSTDTADTSSPETLPPPQTEPDTEPPAPIEPEIEVSYYYELDTVSGRALFSAYKYKG